MKPSFSQSEPQVKRPLTSSMMYSYSGRHYNVIHVQAQHRNDLVIHHHEKQTRVQTVLFPPFLQQFAQHVEVPSPWCIGLTVNWCSQLVHHILVLPLGIHLQTEIILGRPHVDGFRSFIIRQALKKGTLAVSIVDANLVASSPLDYQHERDAG